MKNSILDEKTREDFYIKLYFKTSENYELAGVKRAYLDFSRTLHKEKNETDKQRKLKREETEKYLIPKLKSLVNMPISTQTEFDVEHKKMVMSLIEYWDKLTIGQSQKWVNMSLKYWLLFGETKIINIEKNARFFHIPIDSYVQKGMFQESKSEREPWSKISEYDKYMEYQNKHRKENTGDYPIVDEFKFFNGYINNKN